MGLQYQVDTLEGVDESVSALYTQNDEGKFVLNVEGLPEQEDVSGLKAQRDKLLNEKKEAQRKADEAAEAARKLAEEQAKNSGDLEGFEKSMNERIEKITTSHKDEVNTLKSIISNMTSESDALKLATDLAVKGSEEVLLPHIQRRLEPVQRDGRFVSQVLDKDGKPSAYTIEDLKEEFMNNPAFASVVAGSKASGSGAEGAKGGGATGNKKWAEMTLTERAQLRRENPDKASQLMNA